MAFGLVSLIGVGAVGFIGYQFYSFYFGISGTRSERDKDMHTLIEQVQKEELAPWDTDEIDLISRVGESNLSRQLFGEMEKGVIYSIYHEPIMAFASKYYSAHDIHLHCFRINDDVYHTSISNQQGEILKNNNPYAHMDISDGVKVTVGRRQLHIDTTDSGQLIPVYIADTQIMSINRDSTEDQSRVIVPIHDINSQDSELFLVGLSFSVIDQLI